MQELIDQVKLFPPTKSGKPKIATQNAEDFLWFFVPEDETQLTHTFQMFSDDENLLEKKEIPCSHGFGKGCDCRPRYKKADPLLYAEYGNFNDLIEELKAGNIAGAGVFFTPNEMDGKGRRIENLRRIRCVFAELDDGLTDNAWPLEPSLVVESSKGRYHTYWLLQDSEELSIADFRSVMTRLVQEWGSDPCATDPTRLLRVPGFYNNKFSKYGERRRVKLISPKTSDDEVLYYSAAAILNAFPPTEKPAKLLGRTHDNEYQNADPDDIDEALTFLASQEYIDNYDWWWKFGIAIYRELGDDGFEIWNTWARNSSKYDEDAALKKWKS